MSRIDAAAMARAAIPPSGWLTDAESAEEWLNARDVDGRALDGLSKVIAEAAGKNLAEEMGEIDDEDGMAMWGVIQKAISGAAKQGFLTGLEAERARRDAEMPS